MVPTAGFVNTAPIWEMNTAPGRLRVMSIPRALARITYPTCQGHSENLRRADKFNQGREERRSDHESVEEGRGFEVSSNR